MPDDPEDELHLEWLRSQFSQSATEQPTEQHAINTSFTSIAPRMIGGPIPNAKNLGDTTKYTITAGQRDVDIKYGALKGMKLSDACTTQRGRQWLDRNGISDMPLIIRQYALCYRAPATSALRAFLADKEKKKRPLCAPWALLLEPGCEPIWGDAPGWEHDGITQRGWIPGVRPHLPRWALYFDPSIDEYLAIEREEFDGPTRNEIEALMAVAQFEKRRALLGSFHENIDTFPYAIPPIEGLPENDSRQVRGTRSFGNGFKFGRPRAAKP